MLKATAGGGKGNAPFGKKKIYLKRTVPVKNLPLLLGMTECILKTNRRASSYRNSGYWDSYGKACHLSEEIVQYKDVIKID
jgi:hypothetical protein